MTRLPDTAPLPEADLKQATLMGVRWTALARAISEVAGFSSAVVLAHLIPPAEFGSVAIALVLGILAIGLTNEGFGNPLVQRPSLEKDHLESGALLSLAFGVLMTAAFLLLAPAATTPLFGQRTTELVQLASPLFLLAAGRVVPYALIQRRLGFRRIGLIETASFLVGTVATLALAIAGFDGEAIVLGLLINSGVATALFLASAPSALPRWRPSAARDVAVFGLPAALASLVHASFRNVDYAIIGARLSAAQLGFYYRAFGFSVNYPNRMTAIMARVSFPVFSRAGEAAEMHALRGRFVRVQAAVIFPFLLLLVATAPVGIPWLLGDRWEPAVVPMQILAFAGLTACLYESIAPLLLATGKVRSLLGFNLVGLILYVVAIYLAAGLGLTAVCLAVVGVHLCLLFGTYFFLVHRLFHLPLRSLWDDMAPASVAGAALLLVAFAAVELLSDAGVATVPTLLAAAVAGTLSYLLVMRLLFETVWSDLRTLLARVVLARKRTPGSEADRVPSLARVPAGAG